MKKFLHSLLILFMGINTASFAQQGEAPEVTPWDGKALKVDIRLGDTLTYEYTATDKGTLYVYADDQSDADYLKVGIWGGLYVDGAYDEVIKLEDTGFFNEDNQTGVFGKIELWEGDKLRFTLAAPAESWSERTKFTLKTKFFPAGMAGGSFESPVMLTQNSKVTLATFDNTLEFLDETHATFCSFTAPSDGVASIYTKAYLIYYMEAENFGVEQFKEVVESNKAQYEHEFVVKKGQNYFVVVPNSRFIDVTFKMTQNRLGLSAEFPIEISKFPATLDLVKGDNYYKFEHSQVGSNTIMEVAAAAGWNGNITYLEGTNWGAFESEVLTSDAVAGSVATFYKNLDQRFLSYGNAIVVNFNVKDQSSAKATLTLREPAEGESFEKAIAVTLGENTFNGPARDYWFAYTAEAESEISFASSATIKHVNFTAGVELLVPTNVYRVDEGETIYVCVASKTAGDNTLTITSKEIAAGDYCDNPIVFELGKDITIEGDSLNVRDKFHSFEAEENGFAVFTSPGWSIYFREECGGRQLAADRIVTEIPVEGVADSTIIQFTYKLPVLEGKRYIVELQAVSEEVVIATTFEAAKAGDVCATAVEIENLNDTIKLAYEFEVARWYKVTAEKNGYYTIYAKLGYAANMKTKVGDCDAAETNVPSDNNQADAYMGGYKAAKIYVEEGETLYIYTKTGSENDAEKFGDNFYLVATFAEPRPGENVDLAIEAETETEYTVLNNDAEGYEQWYTYTIPAGEELTITLKATMKFITNSLSFYKEDRVTTMSAYKQDFTQTNLTNEAGETIGKNYAFAAADADRTIYIKVSTVNAMYNPVVWKIEDKSQGGNEGGDDTGVAIEKVATEAPVIYDLMGRRVTNPTKGLYIINGVKRVIK